MNVKNGLIIFVKAPEMGKVKTRIAEDVGDKKTLEIYKELLTHTKLVAQGVNASKHLFYAFRINYDDQWSMDEFTKNLQPDGDLGFKMKHAFGRVLKEREHAIIIGSDCGDIDASLIEKAFVKLESNDVVIGPAEDGGYYLLGMKNVHDQLFDDMPWSTNELLEHTIVQCIENGWKYHLLPVLSDVDYIGDWEKVKDKILKEGII